MNALNVKTSDQYPLPFMAKDILVNYEDGEEAQFRGFTKEDWKNDLHKLLVVIPEAFTPVCETEIGAMNRWYEEFAKLDCELIMVSADPHQKITEWFKETDTLKDRRWKTFSSYMIPNKLGLLRNGRPVRSSVFVMKSGAIVKQEHFEKVGRSFAELHRMLYGYTTNSYCAEGWKDPSDSIHEYRGKKL